MDRALFAGEGDIGGEDLAKLEVRNGEEAVNNALRAFGWNGKAAVGCVVLHLSANNQTATGGQFAARGRLAKEDFKMEAARLWRDAETGPVLSLKVPAGADFKFGDGGLCSDYLDSDGVDFCVTAAGRGNQPILRDEYAEKGIRGFCLRLVCHITRATKKSGVTLAYSVLIYPGTAEEVQEVSDLAKSPSWPGLKVAEGEMALLPHPQTPWGCPVLPLLRTGSSREEAPDWPAAEELRARIAWIMSTSEPGEVCKTKKAMLGKWQKACENPDDFVIKRGPLSWPKPQQDRQTGRTPYLVIQYSCHEPITDLLNCHVTTICTPILYKYLKCTRLHVKA